MSTGELGCIGLERPWPLVGARTMQALDRYTIDQLAVPGALLMESAGRAVAEVALEMRCAGAGVVIVCGSGNNGGDGLVAARHLAAIGAPVRVLLVGDESRLTHDAATNLSRLRAMGIEPSQDWSEPGAGSVLVDALFGTGLSRPPEGAAADAIAWMHACSERVPVLAVDLPSGLDADTGQPLGPALKAQVTVTCGLPKLALVLEPGRSLAGEIRVARIGIADSAPGVSAEAELWTDALVGRALPPREASAHKGSFGHVLLVAGGRGKAGAAALAARGALRAGAGLVTVACTPDASAALQAGTPEAMTAPLEKGTDGGLDETAVDVVLELARSRNVLAVGPGLGTGEGARALVHALVVRAECPLVLDADGINAFAGGPAALKARGALSILTPHPGEAARLLGVSAAEVNRDRIGSARRVSLQTGAVVLLKGAASVVASPSGRVAVIAAGGPVLGSGGTGDVLTGVVAALVGQGLPGFEAALVGAHLHGRAGDRLAVERGPAGVLASEIATTLPEVARDLRARAGDASGHGGERGERGRRRGLLLSFPEP